MNCNSFVYNYLSSSRMKTLAFVEFTTKVSDDLDKGAFDLSTQLLS
jgi:hypothetical protein